MSEAKGLLAVWMEPKPENEGDLNRWYAEEHLPERMAVPGFASARRYVSDDASRTYIALYRLTDVGVLAGEAYQHVVRHSTPWTRRVVDNLNGFVRNEYSLEATQGDFSAPAAPYAYLVRLDCAEENRDEMRRWYVEEHLSCIAGVEGVTSSSLYIATAGTPRFLAVHEVASAQIPRSEAWNRAVGTPWTERMRALFTDRASNLGRLIAQMR